MYVKNRQYNGQKKKVWTIQRPKEKKHRQYNGQKKKSIDNTTAFFSFGRCIVHTFFFWPLYCLCFFSFGRCIVYTFFFWPLYCLSFFSFGRCIVYAFFHLAVVLSMLFSFQYNGQKKKV
jgi:hypothetical protein